MQALGTRLFIGFIFTLLSQSLWATEKVQVAVASNFIGLSQLLKSAFLNLHPNAQINFSYASSAKLYAQIYHGAPYHIFLSADTQKPTKLIKQNKSLSTQYTVYAKGQLAFWHGGLLNDESFVCRTLAIANPKLAPYGAAAQEVMQKGQFVLPKCQRTIVAENISQTWHYAATKNVDAAFVALSQLKAQQIPAAHYKIVPADLHPAIEQAMILLPSAANNATALQFYQFLQSAKAAELMQAYGYLKP